MSTNTAMMNTISMSMNQAGAAQAVTATGTNTLQ